MRRWIMLICVECLLTRLQGYATAPTGTYATALRRPDTQARPTPSPKRAVHDKQVFVAELRTDAEKHPRSGATTSRQPRNFHSAIR